MFAQIRTYYKKAKWIKWISWVGPALIGLLLIERGIILLHSNTEYLSGTLFVVSGVLWFLSGVMEWLKSLTNDIGSIVCSVIIILMVTSGTVLIVIA